MGEGTPGAVAAALPDAQIVVDRFHVAVRYREAVDALRQAECRRLNAERTPERAVPHRRVAALSAGNGGRSSPISKANWWSCSG